MFKNEYQGGPYFEIFTPQGKDIASNWKIHGGIKKVYDKEVKSYVYSIEGTPATTKMQLPKDSSRHSLTLIQRYLIFQIAVAKGQDFSIEIGVTDLGNSKRRLLFSSSQKETQVTPLHAKVPLTILRRSSWLNLCIDMVSMVSDTWRGQTYKAIESICVSANCKLRKIFTMKTQPPDTAGDDELYGCPSSNTGELDQIPKQCQFASDVSHITQLLTLTKIKHAERLKGGGDTHRPVSNLEIDLNSSGRSESGSYHIAFGSKVHSGPVSNSNRKSKGGEGNISNRSFRNTHSRADDSFGSSGYQDFSASMNSKDGLSTGRSDSEKKILHQRQLSDPLSQEEVEMYSRLENSRMDSQMVQPHPPREPSSDRLRRRIRVKNGSANKDRVSSAGSLKDEAVGNQSSGGVTGKGVGHSDTDNNKEQGTSRNRLLSDGELLSLNAASISTDVRRNKSAEHARDKHNDSKDSSAELADMLTRQISRGEYNYKHYQGDGADAELDESMSDVIEMLKQGIGSNLEDDKEWEGDEEETSSEEGDGYKPFHPKAYEESDDEDGSENGMYYFVSKPKSAPRRHLSPNQFDSAIESDFSQSKSIGSSKTSKSMSKQLTKGMPVARGPRPEDDFFNEDGSSSEGEDTNKRKKLPGSRPSSGSTSRPHSGTTSRPQSGTTSRPHSGTSSRPTSNTSLTGTDHKTRSQRLTQNVEISVDHVPKTANISPELRTGAHISTLNGDISNSSFSKMSRKSLREIPKSDARISQKNYDSTKYALTDVTESFEARMLLSMKRHHEEELEDVESQKKEKTQTPRTPRNAAAFKSPRQTNQFDTNTRNMYDFSPSVYTSDDDTSYSTWKAPPLDPHNYQDEMKTRLSTDTLTSSNPRDWSGVFSPPIVFPSEIKNSAEDLSTSSGPSPRKEQSDISPKEISSLERRRVYRQDTDDEDELDLLYDPCLNCYYDPKTCKYYELV